MSLLGGAGRRKKTPNAMQSARKGLRYANLMYFSSFDKFCIVVQFVANIVTIAILTCNAVVCNAQHAPCEHVKCTGPKHYIANVTNDHDIESYI